MFAITQGLGAGSASPLILQGYGLGASIYVQAGAVGIAAGVAGTVRSFLIPGTAVGATVGVAGSIGSTFVYVIAADPWAATSIIAAGRADPWAATSTYRGQTPIVLPYTLLSGLL